MTNASARSRGKVPSGRSNLTDERWQRPAAPDSNAPGVVIRHIAPSPERSHVFGDYHFAVGLAKAFLALGHTVRVDARSQWRDPVPKGTVSIMLRGLDPIPPDPNTISILWFIYPEKRFRPATDELQLYNRVFFASSEALAHPVVKGSGVNARLLYQAFDTSVMFSGAASPRSGITYVANNHRGFKGLRTMYRFGAETGVDINLWGRFWPELPPNIHFRGKWLGNAEVGATYRGSEIVLCDHVASMMNSGFISNRIFDALACAAPVISDRLPSLPEGFAPFVEMVSTPEEFASAVEKIRNEGEAMKQARAEFARTMVERHSFDARARQIRDLLLGQTGTE